MLVLRRVRRFVIGLRGISSDEEPRREERGRGSSSGTSTILIGRVLLPAIAGCVVALSVEQFMTRYNPKHKKNELVFNAGISIGNWISKQAEMFSAFTEPVVKNLLPDLPKPPPGFAMPKTLILNTRGTIIKSSYKFGKGYEIKKRPGLNEFLSRVGQLYEVVLFGDDDFTFTNQIADSLDPGHQFISGRIGREGLCYRMGGYVKNLDYINRDLKNVIVVDLDPRRIPYHSANVVLIPPFTGDMEDRALAELLPFLEHIAKDRVPDVREELDKWGHIDTGKHYVEELTRKKETIMEKQGKGFTGIMKKMQSPQKEKTEPTGFTGDVPKPTFNQK